LFAHLFGKHKMETPKNTLPRLPVAVCVIAGAEAHRLHRALASVAGWTSEIIVVLNEEVSDGTDKIAEEFGAKVFREPWKGFVAQKNSAADKAAQPWLLGLDADEEVSPELCGEIQNHSRSPRSVFRAAHFIAAGGSGMAIGIPTARLYCGGADGDVGVALTRTRHWP
jgi:glycosyltransferase involved in cell wall biosynthesis